MWPSSWPTTEESSASPRSSSDPAVMVIDDLEGETPVAAALSATLFTMVIFGTGSLKRSATPLTRS